MTTTYPLKIIDDRSLPEDYAGPVYVWDIDKTYLSTRFSSVRGLARVPVEFAVDKQAIPGMPEVLRGLRRGVGPEVACLPLYFISASPPFLRGVIEKKMLLDGVEQDGITFKDWLGVLLRLTPNRLFEQVGFKVIALLCGRLSRPQAQESLFGDDSEKDATAYFLYAQLLHGDLSAAELDEALREEGVSEEDRREIHRLAGCLPPSRGRVEKIFIHLEKNTDPKSFKQFGPLIVPVRGAYQLALSLYALNRVDVQALKDTAKAYRRAPRRRYGGLESLTQDAIRRKVIRPSLLKKLE